MTKVYTDNYTILSANMGKENPLPHFRNFENNKDYKVEQNFVPEGFDRIGYGWEVGERVLPYRDQDGYSRIKKEKTWFSVILENEYLKATLVPEMGGKLVALYDKINKRDLFVRNPVFQPGNLALRNAWTSGGVEYNFGQLGHHYQTCEPLHCSIIETDMGEIVRIFTWDRIKLCSYHYDFCLPHDSKYLLTYVRIINPNNNEIPVYWWTNIAAPIYEGGRVIAPADDGYLNEIVVDLNKKWKGYELTCPNTVNRAYDVFFRISINHRPWEVNLDKEGKGFLYCSTKRLIGRKLFTWGKGNGGTHWNEFLSDKNTPEYLEIQGGLAYTQMHSVPMPPNTEWDWLEMYGAYKGPKEVLSSSWKNAYTETEKVVDKVLPQSIVDSYFEKMRKYSKSQGKVVAKGQGWGALENYRAKLTGKKSYIPKDFAFNESDMGEKQKIWKEFLETGILKAPNIMEEPGEYMIQEEWFNMLKNSVLKDNNWFVNFHIGVCYMERLNWVNAKAYFEISNSLCENPWATYSLACIELIRKNEEKALELLEKAYKLNTKSPYILIKLCDALYSAKKYEKLDEIVSNIDPSNIEFERVKINIIKNALKKNDFETIDKYLYYDFATNREGEIVLSDIWFELMARKRAFKAGIEYKEEMKEEFIKLHDEGKVEECELLPYEFDFRMSEAGDFYTPPTER